MREKFIQAYIRMMERVKDGLEPLEKKAGPHVHQVIETARKTAVELEELTYEEAEQIAKYLKRDLQNAALFLDDTGKALKDWLAFDWMLIEDKIWHAFCIVADKTHLELIKFNQSFQRDVEYHSHEIAAAGTLQCKQCGERVHFHKVSEIPACAKCGNTVFVRSYPGA